MNIKAEQEKDEEISQIRQQITSQTASASDSGYLIVDGVVYKNVKRKLHVKKRRKKRSRKDDMQIEWSPTKLSQHTPFPTNDPSAEDPIQPQETPDAMVQTPRFTISRTKLKFSKDDPEVRILKRKTPPEAEETRNPPKKLVRDTSAMSGLPLKMKKWISNPPCKPVKKYTDDSLKKRKRTKPRRNKKPANLNQEQKQYQRRRRQFNYRWNKQLRKFGVVVFREESSPPRGTSEGGVCDVQASLTMDDICAVARISPQ
ncbi:unnamed protein product [Orchesella dallaii]|uniref:Uncharacterized protein n=1 Tax=Orchesella dallaii TaxID=48710 RepID=A0ABP1RW90_9HEXA